MDTTITISSKSVKNKSDFLHLTYNTGKNKDAIISVDSSNFGQSGTVTWDKKSSTLSNIEKVTNWMKQSDKECVEDELTELTNSNEPESKSLILFRCDFNKSTNVQTYYPSLNPFNRSTSLIDYFKDENVTLANSSKVPVSTNMDDDTGVTDQKLTNNVQPERLSSQVSKTDSSCTSENKSENTDEVPLSPESRKKELCHYLQLMNPADKKEILILQNRRSSRVRNLTEQKQSQEKLKETDNDNDKDKNEPIEKSATLKSFKELNIQLNKTSYDIEESEKNYKHFLFPFPPQELSNEIKDFDNVMYKLIPKLKRICQTKNIPCLTQTSPPIKTIDSDEILQPKKDVNKEIKMKTKVKKFVKNTNIIRGKRITKERTKTLRSNGNLKNVPIKKLVEKKEKELNKYRSRKAKSVPPSSVRSPRSTRQNSSTKSIIGSQCEIISVGHGPDDEHLDIDYIMDTIVDFETLSDEHKKCLIESRILSTKPHHTVPSNETNVPRTCNPNMLSPLYGFTETDTNEISKICEQYKKTVSLDNVENAYNEFNDKEKNTTEVQKSNEGEEKDKQEATQVAGGNPFLILKIHTPSSSEDVTDSSEVSEQSSSSSLQEHDYASSPSKKSENNDDELDAVKVPIKNAHTGNYLEINTKTITKNTKYELLPYKKPERTKSLHKSLQFTTKKKNSLAANTSLTQEWDIVDSPKQKLKKQSHFISINTEHGSVLKAFYVDYNLVLCQEFLVSFWMQTPLGNVLGSQNMWIPRGQTQRIVLNNRCLQKDSMEKVMCLDTSVVYIELWMKEHKSEMRQGPVADVFITLYYWKQRQTGLDKKVLQLENINGFADDVQYCVMKHFPKIIVSWHSANEENTSSRQTFIHAYQLASDYQTVSNIYDIEPVDHYVSSLHNIEDYDDLIMGCGENKVTLWNVEFGHIIATIELNDIKIPLSTLWVKCDRGFLFALQQCVDRELRLIAINGINRSWKKLASYFPPEGFDRLKGVCIENGLLLSFYDQGILCWNAETGAPVEEINAENDIITSGTHVILVEDNKIIVKHVLTHLMSMSVDES